MNIGTALLLFYKDRNFLLKIILLPIFLLGCALWIIGSLAHWNTLIMFIIGIIVGCIAFYFVGDTVVGIVEDIIQKCYAFLNSPIA